MCHRGRRVRPQIVCKSVVNQFCQGRQADEPDRDFQSNDGSFVHSLEVLFQIHAVVETGNLIAIAVEHERGLALLED